MITKPLRIFLLTAALAPTLARAQVPTNLPHSSPPPAPHAAPLDPANPYSEKITAMAHDIARHINDDQARALSQLRANYGELGAVLDAESDVGMAVTNCGVANPQMKTTMTGRFAQWRQAVDPVIDAQRKTLVALVKTGIAGDPPHVQAYLELIGQSATWADQHIDKQPARSAAACTQLLGSMDRTQAAMVTLLRQMQWPAAPKTP